VNKFFASPVKLIGENAVLESFYTAANRSISYYLVRALLSFCGPIFVAILICVVRVFAEAGKKKEEERLPLGEKLKRAVLDEIPTKNGLFVLGISLVSLFCAGFRRPKIIFDDPMNVLTGVGKISREGRRKALDSIRSVGNQRPLVILSSNEGLSECFADRAAMLHSSCTFPYAEPGEFLDALNASAKEQSNDINLMRLAKSLTEQRLQHMVSHVPKRYALSIRWWSFVSSLPEGVLAKLMSPEELRLNSDQQDALRQCLRRVALSHDLQSAKIFTTEALACSPLLEPEDRGKVAALVGLDVSLLPPQLPGRLALCWALALADDKEVRARAEMSTSSWTDKDPWKDPVSFFRKVFEVLVKPYDPESAFLWVAVIKPLRDRIYASLAHGLVARVLEDVLPDADSVFMRMIG
jgi:hypothetical protein